MLRIEAFRPTLEKIIKILHSFRIRFHLTGGATSIAYTEPRMTQDVDIVIAHDAVAGQLNSLINSLQNSDFLFDEAALRRAVDNKQVFQLLDSVEALKLDLYPRELIPGELARSNTVELFEGLAIPIASRSDAAISKLIWISKGRHKSRRDLRQLMRIATTSQRQTIEQMTISFGLDRLPSEVLAESDEIDV